MLNQHNPGHVNANAVAAGATGVGVEVVPYLKAGRYCYDVIIDGHYRCSIGGKGRALETPRMLAYARRHHDGVVKREEWPTGRVRSIRYWVDPTPEGLLGMIADFGCWETSLWDAGVEFQLQNATAWAGWHTMNPGPSQSHLAEILDGFIAQL